MLVPAVSASACGITSESIASGKVATGVDIVNRICQGADFTLAART